MLRARRAPRICSVTAATRFGRARLSALRRGARRGFEASAQLRAAFRQSATACAIANAYSEAPRGPILVPDEQGPKPPGSGVCGSARRHRTRSASRSTLAKGFPQERAGRHLVGSPLVSRFFHREQTAVDFAAFLHFRFRGRRRASPLNRAGFPGISCNPRIPMKDFDSLLRRV